MFYTNQSSKTVLYYAYCIDCFSKVCQTLDGIFNLCIICTLNVVHVINIYLPIVSTRMNLYIPPVIYDKTNTICCKRTVKCCMLSWLELLVTNIIYPCVLLVGIAQLTAMTNENLVWYGIHITARNITSIWLESDHLYSVTLTSLLVVSRMTAFNDVIEYCVDVCLTVSRNHAVFLLSSTNI